MTSGSFTSEWQPTSNPAFKCQKCGSNELWFREWESSDGAFEDTAYHCRACGNRWWYESADS